MTSIYYEKIKFETICKNGSEKHGCNATTYMSGYKDGTMRMKVSQFGKNKKEAEEKLLNFLTSDSECIGEF